MNRKKFRPLVGTAGLWGLGGTILAIGLLAPPVAAPARAEIPDFLEIDPVVGVNFGHGYDTKRRISFVKGGGCIEFDAKDTYQTGSTLTKSGFEKVTSTSEVSEEMSLSVSASLTVLAGGTFKGSSKTDVAGGTATSQFNESILAFSYSRLKPTYINPAKIKLKKQYVNMLKDPKKGTGAFKAECGDTFVFGIQQGREFYGTAFVSKQTLEQWSKFKQNATASYEGATVTVDGAVDYAQALRQSFGNDSIKIHVSKSDTTQSNPSTVEQMVKQFQSFNVNASGTSAVKLILSSYSNADGWPIEDPLSPPSNDEKLGFMVAALWDLKALMQDAEFAEGNPQMFALGTTDAKRNDRLKGVTKLKAAWKTEFDKLRAEAVKCLADFTSSCDALAKQYESRNPLAERAQLPVRYNSDCYQSLQLTNLGGKFPTYTMPESPSKGDAEMGDGPVRGISTMKIYVDGTQLKMQHNTHLLEWKLKSPTERYVGNYQDTQFDYSQTAVVFDLNSPMQYGSVHGNLAECVYAKDNPVSAPYIDKTIANTKDWHGLTDAVSGKRPRGQIKLMGGLGMLEWLDCELDKDGTDGKLLCNSPGIKNAYVKLLNKLDIAADSWSPAAAIASAAKRQFGTQVSAARKAPAKAAKPLSPTEAAAASGTALAQAKTAEVAAAVAKATEKQTAFAKARTADAKAVQAMPANVKKLLEQRNKNVKAAK